MYFNGIKLVLSHCKALKNYITFLKNNENYQIKEAIIENCKCDDSILEQILEGIANQIQLVEDKKKNKTQINFLRSFVYC